MCATLQSNVAIAKDYVDLELVLAVDVSLSMDRDEQKLQREGYVAAFRDPSVVRAIQSGPNGRIAVTYVEWAGAGNQAVVMPWRVLKSARDGETFATELAGKPPSRATMTSISDVIQASRRMFTSSPVQGLRRVIDVSGDGANNSGAPVTTARDEAVAAGIIINGLAIQTGTGTSRYTYFDLVDLDLYYKDCVIGGPGAFVLSIRKPEEFATAIRQKLLLEIAHRGPKNARTIQRIQFQQPRAPYDCLIGEKRWQQFRLENGEPW